MRVLTVTVLSLFCLPGCSSQSVTTGTLVELEGADQRIVVFAGDVEPVYSVEDDQGTILVSRKTLSQIQVERPDLYTLIVSARAAQGTVDDRPFD